MVSTVASLVSIGLAVYFYYAGIRRRDLSYYFHPIRTKIATIGEDSRLRATYDGRELKGSLTAMQFAIWNAGDEPIRPDDVLDRVTVTAPPGVRVLDIKVRQEARRVVGFRVDDTQKSEGVLDLSWKILERNDGAVVRRREEAMALVPGVVLLALGAFLLYLAMRQSGVPFDF
jgi:hypothetical protein